MFGWGYKEDARKWREQQEKEMKKYYIAKCKIYLLGDETVDCEVKIESFSYSFPALLCDRKFTILASERVNDELSDKFHRWANDGSHINGSFYPASQIKRIERVSVEEYTDE